jgi:hypothetical protein
MGAHGSREVPLSDCRGMPSVHDAQGEADTHGTKGSRMNSVSAAAIAMEAAQQDSALAAWALVLYEHGMPSNTQVTSYDHYESFQRLLYYGLISHEQYNQEEESDPFFSGEPPSSGDVDTVIRVLEASEVELGENIMNKKKFDAGLTVRRTTGVNALAPKQARRTIEGSAPIEAFAPRQSRQQIPGPGPTSGGIQAFAPQAPARRQMVAPTTFAPPQQHQGLPCTQPGPGAFSSDAIQCLGCGTQIPLEERDVDIVGGPYDDYSHHPHIETALYGECRNCTSIKTGKRCTRQFVIAMTELLEE